MIIINCDWYYSFVIFQCLVDYCDKYPESKTTVKEQYEVCKEMARLLPLKIARLKNQSWIN